MLCPEYLSATTQHVWQQYDTKLFIFKWNSTKIQIKMNAGNTDLILIFLGTNDNQGNFISYLIFSLKRVTNRSSYEVCEVQLSYEYFLHNLTMTMLPKFKKKTTPRIFWILKIYLGLRYERTDMSLHLCPLRWGDMCKNLGQFFSQTTNTSNRGLDLKTQA